MADTFTPQLRLIQQPHLGNLNTWGAGFTDGVLELVETALAGRQEVDVTAANVTLTLANGLPDTSRAMFLRVTGNPGVARDVIVPSLQKMYVVQNATSPAQDIDVRTAANSGVVVSGGEAAICTVDQPNDQVISPIQGGNVAIEPQAPVSTLVFDIENRTAGDATVTLSYYNQGGMIICRFPVINTTISATTFVLAPQTSVPADLIPSAPLSNEFAICVDEAGSNIPAYLFVPTANANWQILKADASAWTAATQRQIRSGLHFMLHQVGN